MSFVNILVELDQLLFFSISRANLVDILYQLVRLAGSSQHWLGLVWLAGGTGGGLPAAPATSPATSPAELGQGGCGEWWSAAQQRSACGGGDLRALASAHEARVRGARRPVAWPATRGRRVAHGGTQASWPVSNEPSRRRGSATLGLVEQAA